VIWAASRAVEPRGERASMDVWQRMAHWEEQIDLGWTQLGEQRNEAAAATFGAVLAETRKADDRDDERRFQLELGLGTALSHLGRFEDAEELLVDALRLSPANGKVAALVGENFMCHGHATAEPAIAKQRYQYAQNYFARARAMGHADATLEYNTACMASQLGDHADMIAALKRALALDRSVLDDARSDPDFEPSLHVPELRELLRL
jgi:tetratricopeptide (TPR) repeat protein